jgi:hypothetical protein
MDVYTLLIPPNSILSLVSDEYLQAIVDSLPSLCLTLVNICAKRISQDDKAIYSYCQWEIQNCLNRLCNYNIAQVAIYKKGIAKAQ